MDLNLTGWHLEYRVAASNSFKFYTVVIAENGVVVTVWGRIGTRGQGKIQKLPDHSSADDVGKKQLYAKKSKGYVTVLDAVNFTMSVEEVTQALRVPGDVHAFTRVLHVVSREPAYEKDKKAVATYYDQFVNRAQSLMTTAGDRPFEEVMAEFRELKEAWATIDKKHGEAMVTIGLINQMLTERLASGSL